MSGRTHVGMILDPRKISVDATPYVPSPFSPPDRYMRSIGGIFGTLHSTGVAVAKYELGSIESELWVEYNVRNDLGGRSLLDLPLIGLVFTEWITDPDFNQPGDDYWYAPFAIIAHGYWHAAPENLNNTRYSFTDGPGDHGSILQLGATPLGTSGSGSGIYSHWQIEIWVDDVLQYSAEWGAQIDKFVIGTGHVFSAPESFKGIVIQGHYGDSGSTYYDDIKVGTSRGASNLLGPVTFDDGTFGPFDLLGNENGVFVVESA